MSASVKHCAQVVDRFDNLPLPFGVVDRKLLKTELIRALAKHAESDAHASEVVDHLVLTAENCPVPAQVVDAARATVDPAPWAPDDEPTGKCGCDHGFLHVDIIRDCGCGRQRYSCCKPCPRCNPTWNGGQAA